MRLIRSEKVGRDKINLYMRKGKVKQDIHVDQITEDQQDEIRHDDTK